MTNEELKKKIIGILDQATGDWYEKDDGLFAEGYTPEEGDNRFKAFIADALIAAGLVDESDYASMKETAVKYKAEVSRVENRAKEAEHRAEVLERALCNLAKEFVNMQGYETWDIPILAKEFVVPDYIKQAKKELAEEER